MKFSFTLVSFAIFALTATAIPVPGDDTQEASGNASKGSVKGSLNNVLKGGVGNETKQEIIIYQCDNANYQKANNNAAEGPTSGLANNLGEDGLFNRKDVIIKIIQGCPEGVVPNNCAVSPQQSITEGEDNVEVEPSL